MGGTDVAGQVFWRTLCRFRHPQRTWVSAIRTRDQQLRQMAWIMLLAPFAAGVLSLPTINDVASRPPLGEPSSSSSSLAGATVLGRHTQQQHASASHGRKLSASQAAALLETMRGDISIQVARTSSASTGVQLQPTAPPAISQISIQFSRPPPRPKTIISPSAFRFMGGSEGQGGSEGSRPHSSDMPRDSTVGTREFKNPDRPDEVSSAGGELEMQQPPAQRPTLPGQPAHATQMQQLVPPPQTVAQSSPVDVEPTEWL